MKKLTLLSFVFSLVFASCSDDKKEEKEDLTIKVNKTEYSLTPKEEVQIEATAKTDILYSTENDFVATVSSAGKVKAGYAGETNILLKNEVGTKTIKITVNPKTNLYPDPSTEFGKISKADLIKKHGTPSIDNDSTIAYTGYSTNATILMYMFDKNKKLEGTALLVKTSVTSKMADHLSERYYPVTYDEKKYYFINALEIKKATIAVAASIFDINNWMLGYTPLSSSTKSQDSSILIKERMSIVIKELL